MVGEHQGVILVNIAPSNEDTWHSDLQTSSQLFDTPHISRKPEPTTAEWQGATIWHVMVAIFW
jgi:hypothetical protein